MTEATFKIPIKAKSEQYYNQIPIESQHLIIKRRGKDCTDFIIFYQNPEESNNNLNSDQIVDIYSEMKTANDNRLQTIRK